MKIAKKITLLAVLCFAFCLASCDKFNQNIAPANQKETFVKYYGHVYSQMAADVLTTPADGGYLLFGSTTSFVDQANRGVYNNFYLVKTDTLGNEIWSKSFGKCYGTDTRTCNSVDVFDNTAQKIMALPEDAGYILAGNCQRITLQNGQRIRQQKRILLIQLDDKGEEVGRSILPNNFLDTFDYEVRDIQIIPDSEGQIALTGTTTEVNRNKPQYTPTTDLTDIYVMRLIDINTIFWDFAYGFSGNDMGVFVSARNSSIIVAGRTETIINNQQPSIDYQIIQFNPTSGGLLNQKAFSDSRTDIYANDACYDSTNQLLTILGNEVADDGTIGQLAIMQVALPDDRNYAINFSRTIKTNGSAAKAGAGSDAGYITLLPNNKGFMVTSSNIKLQNVNNDIHLLKLDNNLQIEWDWLFGTGVSIDKAANVVPLYKTGSVDIIGYAMAGTFDLGTNTSIGLVKTTTLGALDK
jgi:hypothetical protein